MTPYYIGNSSVKSAARCSSKNFYINLFVLSAIFLGILIYLIEVSSLAIFTFKVDSLKQRISELENNNQKTELNLNQSESMGDLDQWATGAGLVAIKQFDYLKPLDSVVAVK